MARRISARVDQATAQGIAAAIGAMVGEGELQPGDKLPTVRALAAELGVSVNTVSDAWRRLSSHGVISTDRRRGTTVRSPPAGVGGRYWRVPVEPGTIDLDLSTGTPDDELLPPIGPVLHHLHADVTVTSYIDPPVVVELEAELRRRWPFPPQSITVVDGAQDALDRVVSELVGFGDTVVIEDPTFPPLIDMVELAGARVIGVALDDEGPRLDALAAAMDHDPVALFIQPRAHNPTGVHLSSRRAGAIAELVAGTRTRVVEDDHSGAATGVAIESVGTAQPDQVIHIQSFSKSHGPDLRIAALSGPADVIDNITRRRQLGPSWTSRLIQQILLTMLTDPDTETLVVAAATEYQRRRGELRAELNERGVSVSPGVGLNMWIPVTDEQRAVVALAAHGIGAAPGRPFRVDATDQHHIRLSIGALRSGFAAVAETVVAAATEPPATVVS
ncbi:MAG: PLP-dependent aminotransferase family protein [Acidimicrobiales bacterium]